MDGEGDGVVDPVVLDVGGLIAFCDGDAEGELAVAEGREGEAEAEVSGFAWGEGLNGVGVDAGIGFEDDDAEAVFEGKSEEGVREGRGGGAEEVEIEGFGAEESGGGCGSVG